MNITMTVLKGIDMCHFYADIYPKNVKEKFGMTANPVTFSRKPLFTTDVSNPMLILPLADAKKMAEEILKL